MAGNPTAGLSTQDIQLVSAEEASDAELAALYQGLNDGTGTYANKKTFSDGSVEFECYTQIYQPGTQDGIILLLAADGTTIKSTVTRNNATAQVTIT